MSMPFRRISPSVGSYRRHKSLIKVVLPLPFIPTTARRLPISNFIFTLRSAQLAHPGYLKETLRNSTLYFLSRRFSTVRLPLYMLSGISRKSKTSSRNGVLLRMEPILDTRPDIPPETLAVDATYCVTEPRPNAPASAFIHTKA